MRSSLLLLLYIVVVRFTVVAQQQPTACADQLRNLYLSKGLPSNTSNIPVIDYETGVYMPGNISYVSALIHFGTTATYYQSRINASVDLSVSYISFDIPLCTTSIIMSCANQSEAGMTNKTNCTNIRDEDQGFPSILAGRLYVYLDQSLACDGTVNVTFMNTILTSYPLTSRYIYDVSGLFSDTTVPLDPTTAKSQYRESGCLYSDGQSLSFAQSQRQFACVDQTISCLVLNTITAVAPPDFSVALSPCTATEPSLCIPLDGTASSQTGNATLYYKWTLVLGPNITTPVYDNLICNDYKRGLFNSTSAMSCFVTDLTGLYKFNLTVYDNTTAISIDAVYVNVVPSDTPLVLPNETIGFYPPTPLRTDPPINRPIVQFPTTEPITDTPTVQANETDSPTQSPTYVNTTAIPSLFKKWPPLTTSQTVSLLAIVITNLIIFVIFIGIYIAMMPGNETNYMDRIRYYA